VDASNPFTPTFGTSPPLLVGRDADLEDFHDGLLSGPGAPERATLVTGLTGSGKTVMLNAYEDVAGTEGWLVISETARPGLVERLAREHLPALLRQHDSRQTESRVTGLSLPGGFGADREVRELHVPASSLRSQLNQLSDLLSERGGGVLITVDEVHRRGLEDLDALSAVVQHAFRERRPVAFAAAGLPAAVEDLIQLPGATFLRRADRRHLHAVGRDDVRRALQLPIRDSGRQVTDEALEVAVAGTGGYPFLIQLVGRHTWNTARDRVLIEVSDAVRGVDLARRKVGQLVHATALNDLSDVDRSFLAAMAIDDGPSRMGDVAARLGVDASYAGVYRRRLLTAEVIESPAHGVVDFALPGLREYLRDHAASSHWRLPAGLRPPAASPGNETSRRELPTPEGGNPDWPASPPTSGPL
jgi:hypothetical protein